MNMKMFGAQIAALRKQKGMTQNELGHRLGISFQAVSKWERGETLPDTAILLDLARVLDTTVDHILSAGERQLGCRGTITVEQMAQGINALGDMGRKLGRQNPIYRHAVEGINEKMNTNIEDAFRDEHIFECFVAEAVIHNLIAGYTIDPEDVRTAFRHSEFRDVVLNYYERLGN